MTDAIKIRRLKKDGLSERKIVEDINRRRAKDAK